MLAFFTVLIMLMVAYAHWREGIFTACTMTVNVFLAGLIAFNFWEPLADQLQVVFRGTFLLGYEDILVLLLLFCAALGSLRALTNHLANNQVEFPPMAQQIGGACFGLITGYLASGFLVCALQTLPWHENFIDFEPRHKDEPPLRRYLPPDRVWLALMSRAGAYAFANHEVPDPDSDSPYDTYRTFDREGAFELNYLRYRRYGDKRDPLPFGKK